MKRTASIVALIVLPSLLIAWGGIHLVLRERASACAAIEGHGSCSCGSDKTECCSKAKCECVAGKPCSCGDKCNCAKEAACACDKGKACTCCTDHAKCACKKPGCKCGK